MNPNQYWTTGHANYLSKESQIQKSSPQFTSNDKYYTQKGNPSNITRPSLMPKSQNQNKSELKTSNYRVENAKYDHGKINSQDFVLSSSNLNSYALRTSSNFNFNLKNYRRDNFANNL